MIYGYLRVSTDEQDAQNQTLGIKVKAKQLGLSISEWIEDSGVSGSKEPEDRKLGIILDNMQSGDIIITSELSRLGRKTFMVMRILEECMKK
ncbi:MAG: recombinase family protein, partial [Erysipelotrichales bacterium]|nr:recombinase family protein [Erysipelotrichales bacterium]